MNVEILVLMATMPAVMKIPGMKMTIRITRMEYGDFDSYARDNLGCDCGDFDDTGDDYENGPEDDGYAR